MNLACWNYDYLCFMSIELSKSQKKIARELIQNSLQMECSRFLEEIERAISNRDQEATNSHKTYLELYKKVKSFDKHIENRYDDLRGSKYFLVLVGLILDGVIVSEDFDRFDEEMKEKLLNTAKLWANDSE